MKHHLKPENFDTKDLPSDGAALRQGAAAEAPDFTARRSHVSVGKRCHQFAR